MKFSIILFLVIFAPTISSYAQSDTLYLDEAISIALKQNYDIQLVSNDVSIAKNNANIANAGMLPSVSGNFNRSATRQNTTQTLLSGETRSLSGANNTNLLYGASLDWTIFDGFQMFARYEQLKELQKLGEATLKQQILDTVFEIISQYFTMVQQKKQLKALQMALDLSKYRLEMAQNRYQIGRASKLEVLAASVDLNTDTTNLMRQSTAYKNIKYRINELIGREVQQDFEVADTIKIKTNLIYDDLFNLAKKHNPDLQAALVSRRIAELDLKQVKGQRLPQIALSSAYTRTRATSPLGFATRSVGNGLSYGVTASLNIFNGFLQRRNEQNAEIEITSSLINIEKTNASIKSQLSAAYQTYLVNLDLVGLEEKNQQIAKQNMDITLEKYRLGSITPLEFREAQRNYVDASVRYSNAQFDAKVSEIALKQIAGALTFD
ncbi:TolC family protein [Olivibacter sitiensis]|uniref:TolC family protein n=1 Tax=Olivibacter sitiensis TaxID=376470 RepID=UPI00040262E6|nr:TolC family protein [Olivibacter sitiensis]